MIGQVLGKATYCSGSVETAPLLAQSDILHDIKRHYIGKLLQRTVVSGPTLGGRVAL